MNRLKYLDGWRGLAIGSVLIGHFLSVPGLNAGRMGVELFFVLSGRLMAEILFVRETPLRTFFPRRVTRIYPALLLFVAASLILSYTLAPSLRVDPVSALTAATMTLNYYAVYAGGAAPGLAHVWSLCIEEHAYILLGLIAAAHRRWDLPIRPLLGALIALGIVNGGVQTALGLDYYAVYWRSDVRGASILMGALAFLMLDGRRVPSITPVIAAVAGVALSLDVAPDPLKYSVGTAGFAIAVATLPRLSGPSMAALTSPAVVWIGVISYSLYLVQQPFDVLAGNGRTLQIAALPVVIALGYASWRWVEGPARDYLNRALERRSAPA